jgi:hypothetical protein
MFAPFRMSPHDKDVARDQKFSDSGRYVAARYAMSKRRDCAHRTVLRRNGGGKRD